MSELERAGKMSKWRCLRQGADYWDTVCTPVSVPLQSHEHRPPRVNHCGHQLEEISHSGMRRVMLKQAICGYGGDGNLHTFIFVPLWTMNLLGFFSLFFFFK